jgi:hypothetical protein
MVNWLWVLGKNTNTEKCTGLKIGLVCEMTISLKKKKKKKRIVFIKNERR